MGWLQSQVLVAKNLAGSNNTIHFVDSASMLKQHKFISSLTTYQSIAIALACGCKPFKPHNSLLGLNKPHISQ
jgi:hypothetical protein